MDNLVRQLFLSSLIGVPWKANARGPEAFDCWHLVVHVQHHMFLKDAPLVEVPDNPSWHWMISQFRDHPELKNWVEVLQPANGLITAKDGAIVLMARNKQPAHCGVYFASERKILHCDETDGVMFQDLLTLRSNSWAKLHFYEPR